MVAELCHSESWLWVSESVDDISSVPDADVVCGGRGRCVFRGGDYVARICGNDCASISREAGDGSFCKEASWEDLLSSPLGGEPACYLEG